MLNVDDDGNEYVSFNERLTKTRQGQGLSGGRQFQPKLFCDCSDSNDASGICPVEAWKQFRKHRPDSQLKTDSNLYLSVIDNPTGAVLV